VGWENKGVDSELLVFGMRLLFYGVFGLSICLERQDRHVLRQLLDLLNCLRQKYASHSHDQASRAGYFAKMNKMGKPCPSLCDEPSYVDTRHHWTSCRRHRSQSYYVCQSLDLIKRLPSDIHKSSSRDPNPLRCPL